MFQGDSDAAWKRYGKIDPYYGVLSANEYRRANLTPATKQDFFQTGTHQIAQIVATVQEHVDASFQPKDALDFGCGVGRLTIPLAQICQTVTGVDISEAMLEEAQKNSLEYNVHNTEFVLSDDTLSRIKRTFNFITSFIVFQHIPVARGEAILARLIELLEEGGVGVLHFTYANQRPTRERVIYKIYKFFPALFTLRLRMKKKPVQPLMQMNEYDLNRLMTLLQNAGCDNCTLRFTNHNQFYGVILIFQKHHSKKLDSGK